jgi:phosphate acyltransferase
VDTPLPQTPTETPTENPVRIAVDAMGGDHAPAEVVRGAVDYVRGTDDGSVVVLVGVPDAIREILAEEGAEEGDRLRIHSASQIIEMDEHPMEAFREKRDASLVVCNTLVKNGEADASFSAGNTGAFMVAATLVLELLPGVRRAGIAAMIPTETGGHTVLVDAGANVDCRAKHLEHFALLGSVYAEKVIGLEKPRVGLLANGEEEAKGNELSKEAYGLLSALRPHIHFIGNVEGNHVAEGRSDVVVCDGFVGNVLLKTAEGIGKLGLHIITEDLKEIQNPEVAAHVRAVVARFRKRLDYAEYGGAPLLGVNGVVLIAHGRSGRTAIANGIRQSARAVRSGYLPAVRAALAATQSAQKEARA